MSLQGRRASFSLDTDSFPTSRSNTSQPLQVGEPVTDITQQFKSLIVSFADEPDGHHAVSMSLPKISGLLMTYQRKRSNSESATGRFIQLKKQFQAESPWLYLPPAKRAEYKVTIKNGFFFDHKGNYLSGDFVSVLDADFNLYAAPATPELGESKVHHSYLSCGLPVRGAFVLYFQCGRLLNVSDESGHYTPTHEEMLAPLQWFCKKLKGQSFLFEDHSRQDKRKEFNGIEYYLLSPEPSEPNGYNKRQISNSDLVPTLHAIKKEAMKTYLAERFPEESEKKIEEEVINRDTDIDCAYETKISLDILLKPINGPDIFDNPELLKHVCLKNIQRKIFSFYGCQLKLEHQVGKEDEARLKELSAQKMIKKQ